VLLVNLQQRHAANTAAADAGFAVPGRVVLRMPYTASFPSQSADSEHGGRISILSNECRGENLAMVMALSCMSFRVPLTEKARRLPEFLYPSGDAPTTAILVSGFRKSTVFQCVTNVRESPPAAIEAEALAGPAEDLRYIADRGLAKPSRGVVVMIWEGTLPLSGADREYLWERFGVPVFVQYLNADNELVATECDGHAGLHLVGEVAHHRGYTLEMKPCPCGDKRPLLVPLDAA